MARISMKDVTVAFKVYGTSARSLKKTILYETTGGRFGTSRDDTVSVVALDKVSLELNDGDRVGIVGHNGAGKTTLLRTLAGIYKPVAGSIEIEGSLGALLDPAAGMDPEATGVENIYLRGHVLGLSKREIDGRIEEIAQSTELGNFLQLPVKTYSAGMFARLCMGILTCLKWEILLVDEGVNAVDAQFQHKLEAMIDNLFFGANILVIATHDQTILEKYCNKLISLYHGSLADVTAIDSGFEPGRLQNTG